MWEPSKPARALPLADLHVHAEAAARIDRLLAVREGRAPFDWGAWVERALPGVAPGVPRLGLMAGAGRYSRDRVAELEADEALFTARIADAIGDAAGGGAILLEVRFGSATVQDPRLMECFRAAAAGHPGVVAVAVISGIWPDGSEAWTRLCEHCLKLAGEGLGGVDFIPVPYDGPCDWREAYRWAERFAAAGLGVTVHAGEFSPVHLSMALGLPGVTRLGHGVHAVDEPAWLDEIGRRGLTVECCLSSNVLLGAVASIEQHPIGRLVEAGIRVTLCTDNPVRFATSIGREYTLAAELGFGVADLMSFTRNAVRSAFLPAATRASLLSTLA